MNIGPLFVLGVVALGLTGCDRTEKDWQSARQTHTATAYAEFIGRHPQGAHVHEAKEAIDELEWGAAKAAASADAAIAYLSAHPASQHTKDAASWFPWPPLIKRPASAPAMVNDGPPQFRLQDWSVQGSRVLDDNGNWITKSPVTASGRFLTKCGDRIATAVMTTGEPGPSGGVLLHLTEGELFWFPSIWAAKTKTRGITTAHNRFEVIDCDPNHTWIRIPKDGRLLLIQSDNGIEVAWDEVGTEIGINGHWYTRKSDGWYWQDIKITSGNLEM